MSATQDAAEDQEMRENPTEPEASKQSRLSIHQLTLPAGIVERIELENFRIHSCIKLDFNQNINFIVGDNGSGKSSILSAIVMALGGKVRATGQGNKNEDVVKYGATKATIKLTLRNTGPDAYHYEKFGASITVERTIIKKQAGGSFVMRDKNGKKVPGFGKAQVTELADRFNIQVENPVMIMTQEKQKSFITAKDKELYEFFNEATQLKELEKNYEEVVNHIQIMKESHAHHKENELPESKERLEKIKADQEACRDVNKLLEEIKDQRCQYAWKLTEESELRVKKLTDKIEQLNRKRSEAEDRTKEYQAKLCEAEERRDRARESLKGAEERMNKALDAVKELEPEKKQLSKEMQRYSHEATDMQNTTKKLQGEIKAKNKEIEGLRAEQAKDMSEENRKVREKIEKLTKRMQAAQEGAKYAKASYIDVYKTIEAQKDAVMYLEQEIRRDDAAIAEYEKEISTIKAASKNRAALFGPKMPQLLDLLDKEKRWEAGRPIGPLGMCIQLKEKKWITAVESALRNQLNSFVVSNHNDRRLLETISKSLQMRVNCIVQRTVPRYKTNRSQGSVEDILEIENDQVANALVDQAAIDVVVLASSDAQGFQMVRDRNTKVKACYLEDGAQLQHKDGSDSYSGYVQKGPNRLGATDPTRLPQLESNKKEQSLSLRQHKEDLKEAKKLRAACEQQATQHKDEKSKQEKTAKDLKEQIEKLAEQLKEEGSTDGLEERISDLQADVQEMEQAIEQQEAAMAEAKEKAAEAKEKLRQHVAKMEEMRRTASEDESRDIEEELQRATQEIKGHRSYLHEVQQSEQSYKTLHEECKAKLVEAEDKLQKDRKGAITYCRQQGLESYCFRPERLDTMKKPEAIWQKVGLLEKRINAQKQRGLDPIRVDQLYRAQKKEFDVLVMNMETMEADIQRQESELMRRLAKQREFQKKTFKITRQNFINNMMRRGHHADLNVNYKEKTLGFHVTVKGAAIQKASDEERPSKKQKNMDAKTLSGGERAFSTVAFLLALGEAMECPFRAMDEFDCFMDAANRVVSIRQLIEAAQNQAHRQFLFLTPLSLTESIMKLRNHPSVGIHQLKAGAI